MTVIVSTTTMIKRLSGMLGTGELSDWEERFVIALILRMDAGEVTKLSDAQVEKLDELHGMHFA